MSEAKPTLGIIAGGGRLPIQLAEACAAEHRSFFVLALEGITDLDFLNQAPHAIVRLGAVGDALGYLRAAGVKELVIAGQMQRPALCGLMPDATGLRMLSHIGRAFFGGDDALLRAVVSFFEQEGFRIVGAETILQKLLAPAGILGKIHPNADDKMNIEKGVKAALSLGKRDLGQAVIAAQGQVIIEEDRAGTDAMIARVKQKSEAKNGVLVKMKKPDQERRVDLPSIGIQTVEAVYHGGLRGIAVEAGGSLIIDKEKTIARADALGLFIVGVSA